MDESARAKHGVRLAARRSTGRSLSLALAEFVGCMNDCTAERRRAVDALATGLREVADMFESMDASAQADVRALGAVEGWAVE